MKRILSTSALAGLLGAAVILAGPSTALAVPSVGKAAARVATGVVAGGVVEGRKCVIPCVKPKRSGKASWPRGRR